MALGDLMRDPAWSVEQIVGEEPSDGALTAAGRLSNG